MGHFHLKLQRRFLFIWLDIYGQWMTAKEGYWGENFRIQQDGVLRSRYRYGNKSYCYCTGTLNLEQVARKELISEYIAKKLYNINQLKKVSP